MSIEASGSSFQALILTLQRYWAAQGCVILQPYDVEVGAGTFHPATALRAPRPGPWRAAPVPPPPPPAHRRPRRNPHPPPPPYPLPGVPKPGPAGTHALL